MRKIKINKLFALLIATASLASCLKKGDMNIDTEETTASVVTLQFIENGSGSTINSGMQYFSGGALTYPASHAADTADYNINLAGPTALSGDLNVTVAVDPTKVLDNYASDSIQYELMPDSIYHIASTTATIKAGERIAHMQIFFYPSKMDPTKSYMLPVIVKDASGQTISDNYSTVYFHVIGNPIAGAVENRWRRWNNGDGSGTPDYDVVDPSFVFSPVNPNTISVESGTGTLLYQVSFTNQAGVLSNFKIKFDAKSITASGLSIPSGPTITLADPINGKYEFTYKYLNSAGAIRTIIDNYTK